MIPKKVITVFEHQTSKANYMEIADLVKTTKSGYQMKSSRPLKIEDMAQIMKESVKSRGLYMDTLISKNILFYDQQSDKTVLCWYVKPEKRKLAMRYADETFFQEYNCPACFFMIINENLYVYFIKKKDLEEITESTVLYETHFPNVYVEDKVCIGSGYKFNGERISVSELIKKVEFNFFTGSTFNSMHKKKYDFHTTWIKNKGKLAESKWNKKTTVNELLSKHSRN